MAVPFVGLTGGMASGKSTALAALARLGAHTLSTDAVVHGLYEGAEVRDLVVARWGAEVAPDGVVDRGEVAKHAFGDPDERRWLESELWPRVGAAVIAFRQEADAADPAPPAAVVETPLLFEAGMEAGYDATIAIVAPDALRTERAGERGHHGIDERNARQLTQDEKASRATYAIVNDGTVEQLEERLRGVLDDLPRAPGP
ncbi:dephospho-CoA kinase [Patulibacter sp.]|uniref:dephospho-CoA kinase n=1 Tax=Patulibacter sp. TaxID=1912859 RepID=UPI0027268FC0|nr:dephospho-CoA kinase [Patulibacter sp.]MDO9409903.1 dephospho-CoA kinase [Patulibacter sp.]